VCGRLYKRADGTLITADCPVGVSRRRRFIRAVAVNVAAVLSLVVTGVTFGALKPSGRRDGGFSEASPMRFLARWTGDRAHTVVIMGDIAAPVTTKYGRGVFGCSKE
jgi:hypothetical protein